MNKKEPEALPIEIDDYTIYVTKLDFDADDNLILEMLPDPNLPEHFTDVFISNAIYDILLQMYQNRGKD